MIRRIGYAGAGLCAFLLPACVSNWNPTDPYWVNTSTGVPVGNYQQNRLPGTTVVAGQPATARNNNPHGTDGQVPIVQTGGTGLVDAPIVSVGAQPEVLPKNLEKQKETSSNLPDPLKPTGQPSKIPTNDDVVVRPKWPNLGGETPIETSSSAKAFENLAFDPPAEKLIQPSQNLSPLPQSPRSLPQLESPQLQPAPQTQPEFGATRGSDPTPIPRQPTGEPVSLPSTGSSETVLIKALRAFQNNRPDEALGLLRQLDPTNQDVLLYLMPLMVRLGEKNMQALPPEELAALVDRLQQATAMLKSKAALRLERVCFCRAVRKFGDVEAFEPRHEFRPGDMVHLYLEIRNFTCKSTGEAMLPVSKPPGGAGTIGATSETYTIKLATRLEICDPQGRPIVHWDLKKDDQALTPPQDYYHTYRFNVPETLAPGNYTLWVTVADQNKPDSPGVRQPMELRVGRN